MSRWRHQGSILIRQRLLISRPAFSTSRYGISKAVLQTDFNAFAQQAVFSGLKLERSELITARGLGHKYSEESKQKSDLAGRTSAGPAAANERGT
jgi:hypothetical protein